jgi:hypothetical protein
VRQLVAIGPRDRMVERADANLVGRNWEMAVLDAIVDRAIKGRGGVVNVVGPPGIGKSRAARETAALAAARGMEVFWAFCESHASDIPFHAVARLLRTANGIADLDDESARVRLRAQLPDADPQDLLLLDDLLGVADPEVLLPQIDPDARRRRLTALINTASLARTTPALLIIEDVHWIDAVSESMLTDFLTVIPQTPSMVLVTSRPEYHGTLTRGHGSQTIALAPLRDSDIAALLGDLLGTDPSVRELTAIIADRAAGNPFFAEEMVRELVQRGALAGQRGGYVCRADVAELSVPATVETAIEARIDRLSLQAKSTLTAASVIGAHFGAEMLTALDIDAVFNELLDAEMIDQVRFIANAEYAFHHPLIRAVAYESQLKSDRAKWHRRLAAVIQDRAPESVEENAAQIAEHLQAAGELHEAYGWHMRAGAWSTIRDLASARISWERARGIADELPTEDPDQLPLRIAPRRMLCVTDWQALAIEESRGRFEELRELCAEAGDKVSLAIGMSGLATELLYAGRSREAARLVSEQMALLESIGDPELTVGLAFVALATWFDIGEGDELLRWSQIVIDQAAGDPAKGADFGIGSPLATTLVFRGIARWWLGRDGWREDLHDAVAMARRSDPATLAVVVTWTYALAIAYGVLPVDDAAMRAIEEARHSAERAGNDYALSLANYSLSFALLNDPGAADRERGLELMEQALDTWRKRAPYHIPMAQGWVARENARRGDRDAAIPAMRDAADELHQAGRLGFAVGATGLLVQTLLERGDKDDLSEAQVEIDRLTSLRAEHDSAMLEITVLGLRGLLARARGDMDAARDYFGRYLAMTKSLGFGAT